MMHHLLYISTIFAIIVGTVPTLVSAKEDDHRVIVTYKTTNTISSDETVIAGLFPESTMVPVGEVVALSHATTMHHRLAPQNAIAATYTAVALEELRSNPNIARIEPDYEVYALDEEDGYEQHEEMLSSVSSAYLRSASNTDDEGQRLQQDRQVTPYGIPLVQADQVNAIPACRKKVCVIDSGYYIQNEDLPNQPSDVTGRTFVGDDDPWNGNLKSSHGTHVAGTIAAIDNTVGVVGTTNDSWLHIGRVFINRSGSISAIVSSINDCVKQGAAVINMSLGSSSNLAILREACDRADRLGVLLVAEAGNSGNGDFIYPAALDSVISVAAVDRNKNRAGFSTRNNQVELSAPGVSVLSTCNGPASYCSKSGTSMASPHVAGVAALIWSHYPGCSNDEIRRALQATAERLGDGVPNSRYGYGLIRARNALTYLENNPCDNGNQCPAVPPTPPHLGVPIPPPPTPKPTPDGLTNVPTVKPTSDGLTEAPFSGGSASKSSKRGTGGSASPTAFGSKSNKGIPDTVFPIDALTEEVTFTMASSMSMSMSMSYDMKV